MIRVQVAVNAGLDLELFQHLREFRVLLVVEEGRIVDHRHPMPGVLGHRLRREPQPLDLENHELSEEDIEALSVDVFAANEEE